MSSCACVCTAHSTTLATKASFDELRWVIQIRQTLDEERNNTDEDENSPIIIFGVPKRLMSSNPPSYMPQQVALGPYHHWRPDLYEMECYKLAAAKHMRRQLHRRDVKFQTLVDQLANVEQKIRGCYHRFLDFNRETLAWMMAMDSCFLLEFLQVYTIRNGKVLAGVPSRPVLNFVDYAGRKFAFDAITRDIIMLENQIPLFVLRKVLELQYPSLESANDAFVSMVTQFCSELFPFRVTEESQFPQVQVLNAPHLLGLLYHMMVPKINEFSQSETINIYDSDVPEYENNNQDENSYSNAVMRLLQASWNVLSDFSFVKDFLRSKPVIFFLKMPWTVISSLPVMSNLVQKVESACFPKDDETGKDESSSLQTKPSLFQEIAIPSVSELTKSGVCFTPTRGDISTICFDAQTATICLPTLSLDVNTEVVLRNLVAYEAASATGPLVFTRYTELMNGIIDTEEDVKLLSQRGIILNHLKSDQEAADLWNGMSKSIRLTKVRDLDKVIEDVNKYYNGRWRVRAGKFMKSYVFASWQLSLLLAAILLLLLLSLQAFCSVYSCRGKFRYFESGPP